MFENEEKLLKKQETLYFKKIKTILSKLTLTEKEQNRVNLELELIHESMSSTGLYVAYKIANKLKEDNKSFNLRGNNGAVLVCYLLGITKVSPIDKRLKYEMPYQEALGTKDFAIKLHFEFNVGPSYYETIRAYLLNEFKDSFDIYNDLKEDEKGKYVDVGYLCVLPSGLDPEYYGEFIPKKNGICDASLFNVTSIKFSTLDCLDYLDRLKKNSKLKFNYKKAIECYIKDYKKSKNYPSYPLFVKNYKIKSNNYWDIAREISSLHCFSLDNSTNIIKCSEDIWHIVDDFPITDEEKYEIVDLFAYGHVDMVDGLTMLEFLLYSNKDKCIDKDFINELASMNYVPSLVHQLEYLEIELQLSFYCNK